MNHEQALMTMASDHIDELRDGMASARAALAMARAEIEQLNDEIARLKRGEFICDRCHLRKEGEVILGDF